MPIAASERNRFRVSFDELRFKVVGHRKATLNLVRPTEGQNRQGSPTYGGNS